MNIFFTKKSFKKNNLVNYNNIIKKYFSVSLSFKNKINSFYKYVHPDVLGRDTPEEYTKLNERSIQEFNSYIDNLNEPNFFEKKTIHFYIKLEKKNSANESTEEKSTNFYEKISLDLDSIKPDISQSNKFAIQSKYIFNSFNN